MECTHIIVLYQLLIDIIARRHGHVFRTALHNERDWRMETWQRTRQGELSYLHTPIPELYHAILNTCLMPSRFYIIPSNVNRRQKNIIPRYLMEGHMQAKTRWCLSWCFVWTACTRLPYMLSLQSRREKSDSWWQAGSVKTAKKSGTVTECGHVTLNCVQMASKQAKCEFLSHIFQFTRLHGVTVMQGMALRDSVVTLFVIRLSSNYCYFEW